MAHAEILPAPLFERHGELVDKKWRIGLTRQESEELARIRAEIDKAEEPSTDAWIARLKQARPGAAHSQSEPEREAAIALRPGGAVEHGWRALYEMKTLNVPRKLSRPTGFVRPADRTIAAVDVS